VDGSKRPWEASPPSADIIAHDDPRPARSTGRSQELPVPRADDRWRAAHVRLLAVFAVMVVAPVVLLMVAGVLTDHAEIAPEVWWLIAACFALLPAYDLWSRATHQRRGIHGVGTVVGFQGLTFARGTPAARWAVASYVTPDGRTCRSRIPLLRPVGFGEQIPLAFGRRRHSRQTHLASRRDRIRLTLRSCTSGIVGQCYLLCGLGAAALLLVPAHQS